MLVLIFFFLLSFILSIAVVWYKLTSGIIWLCILLTALSTFFVRRWCRPVGDDSNIDLPEGIFKKRVSLMIIFFFLTGIDFALLIFSRSGEVLQTPWQGINSWYLSIFFLLSFVLGRLLLSQYKTKTLLGILIIFSFLQHLYLPLSHTLPWGGDVWRHMAVENKLIVGKPELPVLFGTEARFHLSTLALKHLITIPDVLTVPQKYSYGQLWGITVFFAKIFNVSLVSVNIWLMPILWSIALPIILFRIGTLLFSSRRYGLYLAALAALPFPFQALGALTLPVSLGYLTFFFVLMLWLEYLANGQKSQRNLVFLFASLMLFGYSLHFVLILVVIVATYLVRLVSRIQNDLLRRSVATVGIFLSLFIISVIELVTKISYVHENLNLYLNLKHFIGQFSGWYFASAIRPADILSGNIFFNHTPSYAFVSSIFMDWRWWVIPVMLIIWGITLLGIFRFPVSLPSTLSHFVLRILFSTTLGAYIIGWYVLDGDRLFTRRLDAMVAFLVLVFFLYGIKHVTCIMKRVTFFNKYLHLSQFISQYRTYIFILFIFIMSFFITTTYASGPDMRVVSEGEYKAAQTLWNALDQNQEKYCVLADTWVLLPLEAMSAGKIVGGGFPIDYQFGQPERAKLYSDIINNPRPSVLVVAKKYTRAERCPIILPSAAIDEIKIKQINLLTNSEPNTIGDLKVWY